MRNVLVVFIAVVLALSGILALVGDGSRWPAMESPPQQGEAMDGPAVKRGHFAPSRVAGARLVREPQNTWSNLAFVGVGAFLACFALSRTSRPVGVAVIAVGVGSFAYHASASRQLRHLDVTAMYGLFLTMTMLAIARLLVRARPWIESHTRLLAVAALAGSALAAASRNLVIFGSKPLALSTVTAAGAGFFIVALVLHAWRLRSVRAAGRVGLAVALFAAGVVCQLGDRPGGWLLDPDSAWQAHALWHVFAALALLLAVPVLDTDPTQPTPPGPGTDSAVGRPR